MRAAPPSTITPDRPLRRALAVGALGVLLALAGAADASAQGAIDPNVAPRAAALEREGERPMAIDLLGRYLATAPDDGRAWLQLGRFYLFDARDWHLHGHHGDPDGLLYLDFAATARLIDEYTEKFAHPYAAAARGYIDDVIDPRDTRPRLIDALRMLRTKRDRNPAKKHGNIPL